MTIVDQFFQEWTGKRIDYDHAYQYQCVDLILQYLHDCYGIASGVGGDAIDYWNHPSAPLMDKFYQVENTDAMVGDIVVFKTLNYTGDPINDPGDGHIGIATGNVTSVRVEVLEQNGDTGNDSGVGGDAIRTRFIAKNRIAGMYRPRSQAVIMNPITQYIPWESEKLTAQNNLTNKQPTNWWNLNGTTTDINSFHPAAVLGENTPFPVGGYAHHINGYVYAMTPDDFARVVRGDFSTNNGVNIRDLKDVPIPVIATPPAAPALFKPAEKLILKADLLAYSSPGDTMAATTPKTELKARTAYYVWSREGGATCLSTSNMTNDGLWIDETKNIIASVVVPPKITETIKAAAAQIPVPELDKDKWKASVAALKYDPETGQPVAQYFWATNSAPLLIKDLDGKQPDFMMRPFNCDEKGIPHKIPIMMTLEKDGILYGWPEGKYLKHTYQCVPMFNLHPDKGNVFDVSKDLLERVVTHTMRLGDHPKLAWYKFSKFLDGIKQTIAGKDQK